jgi:plasmid stabilization system protein ParE
MAAKLVIAPEVQQDLAEAYAWYEQRRVGLGEEFLSSVDACIHRICRHPSMYAVAHESFQRGLVRRFPYAVFFEHADDQVTVYCIFHTAQDPGKWKDRLPRRG